MLYSRWVALPLHIRHKIAEEFKIVKRGSTEVFSNTIKSDGFVIQEIEGALTVPALQEYLRTPEINLEVLWEMLICKMEGKEYEAMVPTVKAVPDISVLPPEEVKQFKKEYKARVKSTIKPNVKKKITTKTKKK